MHKEDDVKENIDVLPLDTHKLSRFSNKSIDYAQKMYKAFGKDQVFGRRAVQQITGVRATRVSALLKTLLELEVIKLAYD